MKKFIALILIVLCCSVFFASCISDENEPGATEQPTQAQSGDTTPDQTNGDGTTATTEASTTASSTTASSTTASTTQEPDSSGDRWTDYY